MFTETEHAILDIIYVTKRQRINPIVMIITFIVKVVEWYFIYGFCMELVAARSFSIVLSAHQATRGGFSFNWWCVSCRCANIMTPSAKFFSPLETLPNKKLYVDSWEFEQIYQLRLLSLIPALQLKIHNGYAAKLFLKLYDDIFCNFGANCVLWRMVKRIEVMKNSFFKRISL